jgi:hypothetical protein
VTCLIWVFRDNFLTRNCPQSTGEVQRTVRHWCCKDIVIEMNQNLLKGITSQIRLRGLPYHVMPRHIIPVSYHVMPRHIIPCHIVSYHVISYDKSCCIIHYHNRAGEKERSTLSGRALELSSVPQRSSQDTAWLRYSMISIGSPGQRQNTVVKITPFRKASVWMSTINYSQRFNRRHALLSFDLIRQS